MKWYALALLLFFNTTENKGQIFGHHTQVDGLRSIVINDVVSDDKGLLWISTPYGIQKYDMYEYTSPSYLDWKYPGFSNENVLSILPIENRLWIASPYLVYRLDTKTGNLDTVSLEIRKQLPLTKVIFHHSKDGNLWMVAKSEETQCLMRYDKNENKFKIVNQFIGNPINSISSYSTNSIILGTESGLILINTWENNITSITSHKVSKANPTIPGLFKDIRSSNLITNVSRGVENSLIISAIDKSGEPHIYITIGLDSIEKDIKLKSTPTEIFLDNSDNILLGGEELVHCNIRTGKLTDVTLPTLMKSSRITTIHQDKNGMMWVGTNNVGLFFFVLDETLFLGQHPLNTSTLMQEEITSILSLSKNQIVISTKKKGGYYQLDNQLLTAAKDNQAFQDLPYAVSLLKARNNILWVGATDQIYMIEMNDDGNPIRDPILIPSFKVTVTKMIEDEHGNIYFGTSRGELLVRDNDTKKFSRLISEETGLGKIADIDLIPNSQLWISTHKNGLVQYSLSTGEMKKIFLCEPLKERSVSCIEKLSETNFLIGTDKSIYLFESDKNNFVTIAQNTKFIKSITPISSKEAIIASAEGIYKYKNRNILAIALNDPFVFTSASALIGDAVLLGSESGLAYIGTAIANDKLPDPILITSIENYNKAINVDSSLSNKEGIKVEFLKNQITIKFSTLQKRKSSRVEYRYRLEGAKEFHDWVTIGTKNYIDFNGLPSGSYKLNIEARYPIENKYTKAAILPITIAPPFWKEDWFVFLVAAMVGLAIFLFVQLKMRQRIKIQAIRDQVARDLHDDMGSNLSTINVLTNVALATLEKESYKSKEILSKISLISLQTMDTMDEIVWSINPLNDDIDRITSKMREFAATTLELSGVNLHFHVNKQIHETQPNIKNRHDFYMIFKESINNIAKYANSRNVSVVINITGRHIQMAIQDDGQGFNQHEIELGNGLMNMKIRALRLGGTLLINSIPNEGTQIKLEFKH